MGLEIKTCLNWNSLASDLHKQIAGNTDHSTMEKVELEDVEGWERVTREEKLSLVHVRQRHALKSVTPTREEPFGVRPAQIAEMFAKLYPPKI